MTIFKESHDLVLESYGQNIIDFINKKMSRENHVDFLIKEINKSLGKTQINDRHFLETNFYCEIYKKINDTKYFFGTIRINSHNRLEFEKTSSFFEFVSALISNLEDWEVRDFLFNLINDNMQEKLKEESMYRILYHYPSIFKEWKRENLFIK
jgi:hypothetical protein